MGKITAGCTIMCLEAAAQLIGKPVINRGVVRNILVRAGAEDTKFRANNSNVTLDEHTGVGQVFPVSEYKSKLNAFEIVYDSYLHGRGGLSDTIHKYDKLARSSNVSGLAVVLTKPPESVM